MVDLSNKGDKKLGLKLVNNWWKKLSVKSFNIQFLNILKQLIYFPLTLKRRKTHDARFSSTIGNFGPFAVVFKRV